MTLPDDTEPSAEAPDDDAMEIAKDIRVELMTVAFEGNGMHLPPGHLSIMARHIRLALDRFRTAGVREERDRCVKVCQERSAWAEALIKNENDDMWANYSNACDDCAELVGETP